MFMSILVKANNFLSQTWAKRSPNREHFKGNILLDWIKIK